MALGSGGLPWMIGASPSMAVAKPAGLGENKRPGNDIDFPLYTFLHKTEHEWLPGTMPRCVSIFAGFQLARPLRSLPSGAHENSVGNSAAIDSSIATHP
jgi:hypothetical protein